MLNLVLTKLKDGVQIEWVARSMAERKAYTESRSKNRASKPSKKQKNISSTYVSHMVNEDVNEDKDVNKERKEGVEGREGIIYTYDSELFKSNWLAWRTLLRDKHNKDYFNLSSEQAALMALSKLAKNEQEAIDVIQQSLRNGWKDLFKLKKENENGTGKQITGLHGEAERDYIARKTAEVFGNQG